MKYFSEIIRILERFRERRTDTVDTDFRAQTESREFLLYDGIRTGIFPNDQEAAEALYGAPLADTRYSSTKNRLKVRMLNSIFHLNLRRAGFSEAAQAQYSAQRGVLTVQVLVMLGADRVGKHIAERTLHLAEKFALTEVQLSLAFMLRRLAGNMAMQKEFDFWDERLKTILQAYRDELLSFEYMDRIFIVFWRFSGSLVRFSEEFLAYEAELRKMLNSKSTYVFRLNYYRVLVLSRQAANRHKEVISSANEALHFLNSNPKLLQKPRLGEFWMYQLMSYVGVRDFENGERAAKECAALMNEGSNSWFGYSEPKFYLLMNTLRFEDAKAFYETVTSHSRFAAQGDALVERFDLYKFYLNFALRTMPAHRETAQPVKLNFDAMIDRATTTKRDKPGMNMAMRYAQILYLFDTQDYNRIDNLIEPIQNYRSRHITASSTEQSTIFFRLIKIMVRWSFQYKQCQKYGMEFYTRLITEKFEDVNQDQEVQILPYAWLWDYMLEKMKERTVGKK